MQGGSGSYMGVSAESRARCKEMDLSEGPWNSAAAASLTALLLYFIITLEQNVCAAVWCATKATGAAETISNLCVFKDSNTCSSSTHLLASAYDFSENYLIAFEGSNSFSEDNLGTIQPD